MRRGGTDPAGATRVELGPRSWGPRSLGLRNQGRRARGQGAGGQGAVGRSRMQPHQVRRESSSRSRCGRGVQRRRRRRRGRQHRQRHGQRCRERSWRRTARIRRRRSGARREGARPGRPSAPDSWNIVLAAIARADQDLDQATIDKALECWSNVDVRHRQRWRARHGLRRRRRRHGQRLAVGEPHGGDPPGADVPGDRLDRLAGRQLRPGPRGPRQRRAVPDPERRRLHRRVSRRWARPRRRPSRGRGGGHPVPVVLGGLRRSARARRAPSCLARTTRR